MYNNIIRKSFELLARLLENMQVRLFNICGKKGGKSKLQECARKKIENKQCRSDRQIVAMQSEQSRKNHMKVKRRATMLQSLKSSAPHTSNSLFVPASE